MTHLVILIVVGVVTALFVAIAVIPLSAKKTHALANSTAAAVGLALDASIEPMVVARSERMRRWSALGGATVFCAPGLASADLIERAVRAPQYTPAFYLPVVALTVGGAFGAALAAAIDARSRHRPEQRVARSRAVDLRDYVPLVECIPARAVAAAAVTLGIVVSVTPAAWDRARALSTAFTVALALATLAALAVFEVAGRRIVARPQAAGTQTELAWDDALRAENLRVLVTAPLYVGGWALLGTASAVDFEPLAAAGLVIGGIAVLTHSVLAFSTGTRKHYLRRLWPETARAGEATVAPGRVAR